MGSLFIRRNIFDFRSEKRLGDLIDIAMLNILNVFLNRCKKSRQGIWRHLREIQIINNRKKATIYQTPV